MKNYTEQLLAIIFIAASCLLLLPAYSFSQTGVGINATGAAADSSAILDVSSTTKGMLVPRMTAIQRTAISPAAIGLLVYQTDAPEGYHYKAVSGWILLGAGTLTGTGTTNYLSKWTSSTALGNSLVFDNGTKVGIGTTIPAEKLEVTGNIRTNAVYAGGILNLAGGGGNVSTTLARAGEILLKPAPGNHYPGGDVILEGGGGSDYYSGPAGGAKITLKGWDYYGNTNINLNIGTGIGGVGNLPSYLYVNNANGAPLMTVMDIGKVGIGTISPSQKLDVAGTTRTTNLQMTSGATNGYVLTSDATGNATWQPTTGGGGTLDYAYDFGGAGIGRTITADAGAVQINGVDGFVSNGTFGSGTIPATGAGTRMMWYPRKAAFRAGYVGSSQWDDSNIGDYSTAMGFGSTASGLISTAMGSSATASGIYSTAFGSLATASGFSSTAIGVSTTASGNYSTAIGNLVSTYDYAGSFIYGDNSTAIVTNSTAFNQFMVRAAGGYVFFSDATLTVPNTMVFTGGNLGIGTTSPTSKLQVVGLPAYINNAAAIAGGLSVGAFYRTGGDPDVVCVVH